MGWGVLLAWSSFALPFPFHWIAPPALALSAFVPRSRGTRASLLLGAILEACVVLLLWEPQPPARTIDGNFRVSIEREIRPGRYEGALRGSPAPSLDGRLVRVVADSASVGDLLSGAGSLRTPRPSLNPGGFDEARWAASAGLAGTVVFKKPRVESEPPSRWAAFRDGLGRRVRAILSERLEPASADLWTATLLADGSRLPADVNTAFRQTGLYHMLSVSGFHLVVLGGATITALSLLRAGARASSLGAFAVVWLYVAVLGWPDPAVRSGVAFTGFVLARWTGRRAHAGNALGLGTAVLVLIDPNCPFQAGVQLTVAATAALIWVAPGLETLLLPRRAPRWTISVMKAFVASVAATLATAPILAWNTGLVPWIGIPAGVLASGFFSAGFLAALAVALFGFLPAAWSEGFAGAADLCARAVLEIALRAGSWDAGWFETIRPSIGFLVLWSVLLVLLSLCATGRATRRRALLGMAVLAPFFVWNAAPRRDDALTLDFLAVGQGDATLVRLPDRSAWLVDGGPATRGPRPREAGTDVVLPALRALRVERLEGVALSHPDLDHWGGLPSVVEASRPRVLLEAGASNPDPSKGWDSARRAMIRGGIHPLPMSAGQFLPLADRGALVALAPGRSASLPDRNAAGLVLSARWGKASVLLAGDAEIWTEARMLESGTRLGADILKVAHHGSKGSSGSGFLSAVHPRWALLSCGERNRYGHPHREALERIAATGARVLDTRLGAWEARLHADGRVEVALAESRWWNGPWRRREVSLPASWSWNRHSGKSSKERRSSDARSGESSRPTTSCPTSSPVRGKTDRS